MDLYNNKQFFLSGCIFGSSFISSHMKQCMLPICESILRLAGDIFPDFSYHFPVIGSMEDISPDF